MKRVLVALAALLAIALDGHAVSASKTLLASIDREFAAHARVEEGLRKVLHERGADAAAATLENAARSGQEVVQQLRKDDHAGATTVALAGLKLLAALANGTESRRVPELLPAVRELQKSYVKGLLIVAGAETPEAARTVAMLSVTAACHADPAFAFDLRTAAQAKPAPPATPFPSPEGAAQRLLGACEIPPVAAAVNGRPILLKEARIVSELFLRRDPKPAEHRTRVYENNVNDLIARELLYSEALRRGLAPDPKRIEDAERQARAGFPDEKSFVEFLTAQGFDLAGYREQLRIRKTADALSEAVTAEKVKPATDDDARRMWTQYHQGQGTPTAADVVHWREQIDGKQRAMAVGTFVTEITQKATIEKFYSKPDQEFINGLAVP
jgi:hypothetical protein